jgi:hypothetical protein
MAETMQMPGLMTDVYLHKGVEMIDAMFGEGYAKANPALLAAFVTASANEMSSARISHYLARLEPLQAMLQPAANPAPHEEEHLADD